jgi:ion channel
MHNQHSWAKAARNRKFKFLFLCLLILLVLYPFLQDKESEFLAFRIFGCAVILLSVYVVSFRRVFAWLAFGLAIPTLVQRLMPPLSNAGPLLLMVTSFSFVFDLFIIVIIFRLVFATDQPNSETIFGALCIYLLVGFSFSNGYFLLATLQPGSFSFDVASNFPKVPGRFTFIYYSFGTLTSLGAPGITPASHTARSLTVIEAILGVLYLAVLISRLISMYKRPVP